MLRKMVIFAALCLFGVWLLVHWGRVTGDADAVIRFSLGCLFALLIILRGKDPEKVRIRIPDLVFPLLLALGTVSALGGIIFRINMLEWAGVLALLAACCLWVVPRHYRGDVILAFVVLFWVHPLPGQIFGWMQGAMQRLSVMGSEVVLHTMNVRVWGDGIVLRTGYQIFLVPEVCSGMRTSVTVFLCALGVGLLLRLKWYETIFFIVLGLLQVLVLNIVRISFMVVWAPRMPPEWAENFLHDSLGIFLMIGIALVQFEAGWWCWWSRRRASIRAAIARAEVEPRDEASIIPHSLQRLLYTLVILAGLGLVGLGIFTILYKTRDYHRKEMVREVAEGLLETDVVSAERAIREARRLFSDERALLYMHAYAMIQLGHFGESLALLEAIEAAGHTLNLEETILKSWSLSREGRLGEARQLIGGLGSEQEQIPGVAILKAEFAAVDGVPAAVSRYIIFAAQASILLPRVRALFPYLAGHEQWAAIAAADHDVPYREFYQALIALYANQQTDNLSGLMRTMHHALSDWPDDPRLLGPLYEIAVRRQGGEWEYHFEQNLRANLGQLNVDGLAGAAEYCWRLGRADLAWLVYVALARQSPDDPALLVAPVQFGLAWTQLSRRALRVPADEEGQTIDVRPILDYLGAMEPIAAIRQRIPHYGVAAQSLSPAMRKHYFRAGLTELERRASSGSLGPRLYRLYPTLLAQLGRYPEAHAKLDEMLIEFPDLQPDIFLQHAVLYNDQQRWADSYEMLQLHLAESDSPTLTAALLEVGALMNMNLAVAAMDRLQHAAERFPGSVRLDLAESAIWDVYGFKSEALHILRRTQTGSRSSVAVALLEATGRITEGARLRGVLGMPRRPAAREPWLWLPPADLVLTPLWPAPPETREIDAALARLREQHDEAGRSSFVQGLCALQIAWYASLSDETYVVAGPSAYEAMIGRWEGVGRTAAERAAAVYQLAMYAARQRDHAMALAALARASALLPENAAIWRARLALAGKDDPALVDAALVACPADSEIFLAALVSRLARLDEDAAREMIATLSAMATQSADVFPVETLVRAGSYLLSQGWRAEVIPLARAVAQRAESLLAAHVFVMRSAMSNNDVARAIQATLQGIELAVDKVPFYRILVDLKVARREVDRDLLEALEYLQERQPEDTRWSEVLGGLYFERGDFRRALVVFGTAIDQDIGGVQVQTLLLAAETARLENRLDRAVYILESAYELQPENPQVLNNLVYVLAQRRETLGRARLLLPALLAVGQASFAALDTAAVVAMRAGDLAQAETWLQQALALVDMDAYGAHEVRLNLVELYFRQGRSDAARATLAELHRDGARPDYVDRRAREMLRDLDREDIR